MAMSKIKQDNWSTTAKDYRDDFANFIQPYANWEQFLLPAPSSIALLGELVRISSEDFSINKNPPKDGFKFIRYPDSFRACLMQVCNAGWQAFNEAHKNMDQIRLYTGQVPDYIKNVFEIIVQEDTDLVKAFLPAELQNIEHISRECLQLAHETEGKFSDVINLMEELVQTLINAKQNYNMELEEIERNIKEESTKLASAKDAQQRAIKDYERAEKLLAEADEDYKKAMSNIPTGWERFATKLSSSLLEQLPSVARACFFGEKAFYISSGISALSSLWKVVVSAIENKSTTSQTCINEKFSTYIILVQSTRFLQLCAQMKTFYEEDKINWTEVYDQEKKAAKSDFLKEQFERIKENISKSCETDFKMIILSKCEKGISICTELAKYAPKGESDDVKTKEWIQEIKNLNTEAEDFDNTCKLFIKHPPLSVEPPHSSSQRTGESSDNLTHVYLEQTAFMLRNANENYALNAKKMEEKTKELDNFIIELQHLEPKKVDFEKKIKVLAKGLRQMGQLKEQWGKLVNVFQVISNIIKTIMTQHINKFNRTAEIAWKSNYTYAKFVKDKIYTDALNASAYAYLVNMISATYTEVSAKYLIGSVSTLGKLMTIDPDEEEFSTELRKFKSECVEAKGKISEIAANNLQAFVLRCQNRITKIRAVLYPVLPPKSEEENLKLEEIVQEEK